MLALSWSAAARACNLPERHSRDIMIFAITLKETDISARVSGIMRVGLLLLASILMLGACARQPKATLPTAWARVDGQPVDPALLEFDSLTCKDELPKPDYAASPHKADKDGSSRAVVDDFVSCMKEHGYVQIKKLNP
jgi:hypothetical protein